MDAATIIGIGFATCTGTLLFVILRSKHAKQPTEEQRATEAAARVGLPPAGPDVKPGRDAAALDWIELTYGADAYDGPGWAPGRMRFQPRLDPDAGFDRLQAAIDEPQEGDQP